jgi:hypothetical protein
VRRVHLRAKDDRYFDAVLWSDGCLSIEVQDLAPPDFMGCNEYEYGHSVAATDVPRIVAALGGSPGEDVLTLVHEHRDEILDFCAPVPEQPPTGDADDDVLGPRIGEAGWLEEHGIGHSFWNRVSR